MARRYVNYYEVDGVLVTTRDLANVTGLSFKQIITEYYEHIVYPLHYGTVCNCGRWLLPKRDNGSGQSEKAFYEYQNPNCSPKCGAISRKLTTPPVPLHPDCLHCGAKRILPGLPKRWKRWTASEYCSKRCAAIANSQTRLRKKPLCLKCGAPVPTARNSYCSMTCRALQIDLCGQSLTVAEYARVLGLSTDVVRDMIAKPGFVPRKFR